MTEKLRLDSYGRIAHVGIHDALVRGFRFTLNGNFDICMAGTDGGDRWLSLAQTKKIGFKDLIEGMIVEDVFCAKITSSGTASISHYAWRVLLGDTYTEADLSRTIENLSSRFNGYNFISIESSYGGAISVISADVSFGREEEGGE